MVDMIPNLESGKLEPVAVTPDYQTLAQDLKSKGFTYQDIKEQGTSLLRGIPKRENPEGSRPSDPETTLPEKKEGGTPKAVQELLNAYEGLETEEATPVQGSVKTQVDEGFSLPVEGNVDWSLPLDMDFKEIPAKTEGSNKELANIVGSILNNDTSLMFKSLQDGMDDFYRNAVDTVSDGADTEFTKITEAKIAKANTTEEVVNILKDTKRNKKGNINLADLRAFSVNKLPQVLTERAGYVTKHTVENMFLAQEVSKREQEVSNSITFLSGVADILEYSAPILGVASEETSKYRQSVQDVVDNLEKATPEQQMAVLSVALDTWEQQETLLFQNNNSFMTLAQFGVLKDTLLQGGTLLAEGNLTKAQKNQYIETIANLGFEVTTVTGIFDSIKGLVKLINLRSMGGYQNINRVITPEIYGEVMGSMNPNRSSATTVEVKTPVEVTFEEAPRFVDRRKNLVKSASEKNTTLFRKTLEEEKKELGSMKASAEQRDVNKEARALAKEKKIKFKAAVKEIKEDINKQALIINNRLGAVQEHILKFDSAASAEGELSRIGQMLKDGRMKEEDLFVPTGVIVLKPTTRTKSNVVNTEYIEVPLNKTKLESESGLKGVQEKSGMDSEELAARQAPTPNDETEIGMPNSPVSRSEITDLDLAENDLEDVANGLSKQIERQGGTSLARATEKESGASLNPIHSATAFKGYKENDNSIGMFTFLLQDGARGGFDNITDAQQAMRLGTAGYDSRVVEKNGKWYVEIDVEHYINPDIDTKGLYISGKPVFTGKVGLSPLRVLGETVFKGIYALKGLHRSRVQGMEDRFKKAIRGLNSDQGAQLNDALLKGDLDESEWNNYGDFKRDNKIDDLSIYNAYRDMRKIYNEVYEIRNKNYYNKLRAANMKFVDVGDGNLGKVLNPNSKVETETADGFVLDIETGVLVKIDPKDGYSYVRLTNAIEESNSGARYVVRIPPEKISALPMKVLNKRKGHIDRMYRDSGWIVKQSKRGKVEGVEQDLKPRVTHIVASKADADRLAEETGGLSERARENDDLEALFGDDQSIQFSYGSSHTKKRNETLRGPDGEPAPVLNAFEAMGKTISQTDLELGTNIFGTLRARFYKEFEDLLENGKATPFDYNVSRMIDRDKVKSGKHDDRLQELKNWHVYISRLASGEKSELYKSIDKGLSGVTDAIFKMYNRAPVAPKKTDSRAFVDAIQKLVAEVFVVFNPFYQIPQNLVPTFYLGLTQGTSGVRSVTALLFSFKKAYKKGDYKRFSKIMGITEEQSKALIDELRKSGLVDAVGRSSDFLDLARGDLNVGATTRARAGVNKAKRVVYSNVRDTFKEGGEASIALMNMLSYITEYKKLLKKGGTFDSKGKVEVSFQAQKNLQNQNSLDQFWYQAPNQPVKPFFLFFQHMHKVVVDMVLEPQYRVLTQTIESVLKLKFAEGRYFGKQAGPYAQTYAQSLAAMAVTYTVFGLQGGLGSNLGGYIEDQIRKAYPEISDSLLGEGMMDGFLSETFNGTIRALGGEGAVNLTKTFGPSGFIDMFNDFIVEGLPNLNPFGASAFFSENIAGTMSHISSLYAVEEIDTLDKVQMIASEVLTIVPVLKNIEKAAIGYMFEQMPAINSLSGKAKITAWEGALLSANIQPDLVTDYHDKSSFSSPSQNIYDVFKDKAVAKRITDAFLKAHARELSTKRATEWGKDLFNAGEYDEAMPLSVITDVHTKWVNAAKSLVHEDLHPYVIEMFAEKALMSNTPTYQEYGKNYSKKGNSGDKGSWMGVLKQKANGAESLKDFELLEEYADFDDEMYRRIKEQDD